MGLGLGFTFRVSALGVFGFRVSGLGFGVQGMLEILHHYRSPIYRNSYSMRYTEMVQEFTISAFHSRHRQVISRYCPMVFSKCYYTQQEGFAMYLPS